LSLFFLVKKSNPKRQGKNIAPRLKPTLSWRPEYSGFAIPRFWIVHIQLLCKVLNRRRFRFMIFTAIEVKLNKDKCIEISIKVNVLILSSVVSDDRRKQIALKIIKAFWLLFGFKK